MTKPIDYIPKIGDFMQFPPDKMKGIIKYINESGYVVKIMGDTVAIAKINPNYVIIPHD